MRAFRYPLSPLPLYRSFNRSSRHCVSSSETEKPDPPNKVAVSRVESRSIGISWSAPYSGNSPIVYYLLEFKEVVDEWTTLAKSQRIPGNENKATLNNLWPGTAYHVRLFAENSMGRSEASQVLHTVTETEAPSEAPTDVVAQAVSSKAVRVLWKPGYSFRSARTAHLIKGYYVGFKSAHSPGIFSYKTVDTGTHSPSGDETGSESGVPNQLETVITNLERLTKYVIVVKAFNRKGSGPASEEVYVKTNDVGRLSAVFAAFAASVVACISPQTQDLINHPLSSLLPVKTVATTADDSFCLRLQNACR